MTRALTTGERRVIIERRHGWESATPALLAKVFDTTPQHITTVAAAVCASCGARICGCSDTAWSARA